MAPQTNSLLVVDDDADILEALAAVFREGGYVVHLARDGQEALDILVGGTNLHAMILDLMMPRLNGFDVIEQLKKMPRLAGLRVIVHSANRGYDADDLGVFEIVRKPSSIDDLLGSVSRALAQIPAAAAPS
jgi:chemosensory pili system protein ChpA (sensor histidine kinase/response regulator)